MITGLNQQGLCEEPGFQKPTEVHWRDADELPTFVCAGFGCSFIVSHLGNVYSFGNGRYGVLGHGDCATNQVPRQIMSLNRQHIKLVAAGSFHVAAMNFSNVVFTWGRNNCGQLGLTTYSCTQLVMVVSLSLFCYGCIQVEASKAIWS